jgi:hypothetical protein
LLSHVLWPAYMPFAALLLEPAAGRRWALWILAALGAATALYLLYTLLRFPITADAVAGRIRYLAPHFYVAWVMAAYLTATCANLLISSHRAVVAFGALALASALVTYLAYAAWFISVWCFFAAALSAVVWLHFRRGGPGPAGTALAGVR